MKQQYGILSWGPHFDHPEVSEYLFSKENIDVKMDDMAERIAVYENFRFPDTQTCIVRRVEMKASETGFGYEVVRKIPGQMEVVIATIQNFFIDLP